MGRKTVAGVNDASRSVVVKTNTGKGASPAGEKEPITVDSIKALLTELDYKNVDVIIKQEPIEAVGLQANVVPIQTVVYLYLDNNKDLKFKEDRDLHDYLRLAINLKFDGVTVEIQKKASTSDLTTAGVTATTQRDATKPRVVVTSTFVDEKKTFVVDSENIKKACTDEFLGNPDPPFLRIGQGFKSGAIDIKVEDKNITVSFPADISKREEAIRFTKKLVGVEYTVTSQIKSIPPKVKPDDEDRPAPKRRHKKSDDYGDRLRAGSATTDAD